MQRNEFLVWQKGLLALSLIVLVWSGINPHDFFTWFLESVPGILGLGFLAYYHAKVRVTSLLFTLICLHAVILFVGGKYTYAEVPLGFWLRDAFGWTRNNYDKIGHFFQGFEPAILAREVLLRRKVLPEGRWLSLFAVSICLAFSAFYELIEWWVATLSGQAAEAFLGTQGDPWDTQSDMFMALLGACVALGVFSRWHRRQLKT